MRELSSFWSDDGSMEAVVIKCNSRFKLNTNGDQLEVKKAAYLVEVYNEGQLREAQVFNDLEKAYHYAEEYVLNHAEET